MDESVTRRSLLQAGLCGTAVTAAGCLSFGGGPEADDVVVRNNRNTDHRVRIVVNRDSYFRKSETTQVTAGDSERLSERVPSSDWDYPFLIETYVDGDHDDERF